MEYAHVCTSLGLFHLISIHSQWPSMSLPLLVLLVHIYCESGRPLGRLLDCHLLNYWKYCDYHRIEMKLSLWCHDEHTRTRTRKHSLICMLCYKMQTIPKCYMQSCKICLHLDSDTEMEPKREREIGSWVSNSDRVKIVVLRARANKPDKNTVDICWSKFKTH